MKTTALSNIKNSKVFVKVDFDIAIENGVIQSDYRIKRCAQTIINLKSSGNTVVLFTKIGRPEGKIVPELSTLNILGKVKELIGETMYLKNTDELEYTLNTNKQGLYLYENTRFYKWEEDYKNKNVKKIANLFDYYVDESFATSHRQESSNFYIPNIIGNISMGINYSQEIKQLRKIKEGDFKNPSLFILGGAKAETKIPMVEKMVEKFTYIIVGGKLCDEKEIVEISSKYKNVKVLKNNDSGFDINDKSIEVLSRAVSLAKTVVWNGPVGFFEKNEHSKGTCNLIKSLEKKQGLVVAGGGDTISAIEKFGNFQDFTFISTGGGAMFAYLSGNPTNFEKLQDSTINSL